MPAPRSRSRRSALEEPLTRETLIPVGQSSSQLLRSFFEREIGPRFRFDAAMRDLIAAGGHTLGDAIEHWHRTRGEATGRDAIEPQFQFNRFMRDWHAAHPGVARSEGLAAWREHRARPGESRNG